MLTLWVLLCLVTGSTAWAGWWQTPRQRAAMASSRKAAAVEISSQLPSFQQVCALVANQILHRLFLESPC